MAKATKKRGKSKKEKKNVPSGIVHIQSTFNNTIVTITDPAGNVIAQSSAGRGGVKGSRKSTPFAAQLAGRDAIKQAMDQGLRVAEVGREEALRSLQVEGLTVTVIRDVTPIPHNGCRPPKRRRV
jgi:small subunit ribosomal protein S11